MLSKSTCFLRENDNWFLNRYLGYSFNKILGRPWCSIFDSIWIFMPCISVPYIIFRRSYKSLHCRNLLAMKITLVHRYIVFMMKIILSCFLYDSKHCILLIYRYNPVGSSPTNLSIHNHLHISSLRCFFEMVVNS